MQAYLKWLSMLWHNKWVLLDSQHLQPSLMFASKAGAYPESHY